MAASGRPSLVHQACGDRGRPGCAVFGAGRFVGQCELSGPTAGDFAILRFLAAAEILETDLWEQYNELGGLDGGNPAYVAALENVDSDAPAYISGNPRDERSHAKSSTPTWFLRAPSR